MAQNQMKFFTHVIFFGSLCNFCKIRCTNSKKFDLGNRSILTASHFKVKLAGGSLRSPPTRNTAKYCTYIIISSDCLVLEKTHILSTSGSLALLGSLSAPEYDLYSEWNTFWCAAGVRSMQSWIFHESISFVEAVTLF